MGTRRQRLAQRRKLVGLTQEELAEQIMVDRSTVARWESGDTQPQPWLRRKLAETLSITVEQLDMLLSDTGPRHNAVDRVPHAPTNPRDIERITITQLHQQVRRLDATYDTAPSTSLLADTGQCLGRVSFLRPHTIKSHDQHELDTIEAEAATLMGQLVWDASQRRDHMTASAYFDQAVAAAQQVGNPTAEGLALLRKSFVALYGRKNPRSGLALTTRAGEVTRGFSHVLTGLARLHAAEAHAMLGHRPDCEQALAEAERCFEHIGSTDTALALFSPTQLGRLTGSCYLHLRRPDLAQPVLEQTAAQLRDRSKSQAVVLGNLALTHIRQRQINEASDALHKAIDVIELTRGGGGLNIVFEASRELRPWQQHTAVQDVYDRLHALMTAG